MNHNPNKPTYQIDSNIDYNQEGDEEEGEDMNREMEDQNIEDNQDENNIEGNQPEEEIEDNNYDDNPNNYEMDNEEQGEEEVYEDNNRNISLKNSSLNKNREEFIEKFQSHHSSNKVTQQDIPRKRWDCLYTQSKLQRMKIDNARSKKMEEKERQFYTECTFSPKLNKNYPLGKLFYNTPEGNEKEKENMSYPDIVQRMSTWAKRKNKKIEKMKKTKTKKEFEECNFSPETVIKIFFIFNRILEIFLILLIFIMKQQE